MRYKAILFAALIGLTSYAGAAVADPHDGYKQAIERETKYGKRGEYKYEEKGPGYKYEYKRDRHGNVKVEYKGKGGPPPWAPAHGYRRKHEPRYDEFAGLPPLDLELGYCNRDIIGGLLGATSGAALGSTIGSGDGRTAAIVGGAVLGPIVGGSIGRSLDQADHNCVGQALEQAEDGQTIIWDTNNEHYEVQPTSTYQTAEGQHCREYITTSRIGGRDQQVFGRACRQPDGSWKLNV